MKIDRKHIILALAGVALFFVGYRRGYEKPASEIGIARVEFVVVDAVTGETLELYGYSSPSMGANQLYQGAFTMARGSAFNSFYAISDAPLTFSVWDDRYDREQVEVPIVTKMGSVVDSHHQVDIVTIKLRRQGSNRDDADQPATADDSKTEGGGKTTPELDGSR